MSRRRKRLWFYGGFTALVMLMIFCFSAQDGTDSGNLSNWFSTTPVGRLIMGLLPPMTGEGSGADLRKFAHMTEFALLAFFSFHYLRALIMRSKDLFIILCTFLFCFFYACTDEFHQIFVPGRVGCFRDVLIDCAGSGFCLILLWLFFRLRKDRI